MLSTSRGRLGFLVAILEFIYKLNKCNLHDRKIAFSAGMTLFVTTSLFHFFEKFFTNTIKKTSNEVINMIKK